MDQDYPPAAPIKSALFVDFDNIYIGLNKTDPLAAERFASDPARWLAWLESGVLDRATQQVRPRSVLIRRCYPNPDAGFRRYRSFFTSAAFSVIDCPSMTRTGKNSADIYMVMDILDTLNHKTNFDEFIIFSGDSDFMPVLLRLRAYDRRTTTLAIDFMPPAYKAACDLVISEEEFIEDALGISDEGNCNNAMTTRARVPVAILKAMAGRLYAAACENGEVAGADLPDILKDFREFRDSNNWLGFGTSQRLAEALVCSEPRLYVARLNPMMYKVILKPQIVPTAPVQADRPSEPILAPVVPQPVLPSMVVKPAASSKRGGRDPRLAARQAERSVPQAMPVESAVVPAATVAAATVVDATTAKSGEKADQAALREQVIALVREVVAGSSMPVLLARASQHVVSTLGPQILSTQWAGSGTFKRLLLAADNLGLEISNQPEPGYIFDPRRHEHPTHRGRAAVEGEAALPAPLTGAALADVEAHEPALAPEPPQTKAETYPSEFGPGTAEKNPYPSDTLTSSYPDDEEEEEDVEEASEDDEEEYEESLPSLEEFARRVGQVTGAPDLSPGQYALVFRGIVAELQKIADGQKGYNTYQSSKAISDWCAEQNEAISRSDVVLILKGIIFQDGIRFSKHPGSYAAEELAAIVRKNIKALCRRSRMVLSDYEDRLLDEWILGGLEEEKL
jgi:hypothetical protein